jgi:hypothetical protein
MRELFWQNVMREMLTSLSVLSMQRPNEDQVKAAAPANPTTTDNSGAIQPANDQAFDPSLFDGRLAVVTRANERIPIASVFPLFACGINTPGTRSLSAAVECTVFQIRTPDGHVFTLPLHEIRGFHALSEEVMERMERAAAKRAARREADDDAPPFGFAAFTSLARGLPSLPLEPPPSHPTE